MKTILAGALLAVSAAGYAQQSPKDTMAYRNTIAVLPGDDHETIIRKAAHVIPTANQYAALQNEFIAFIHFGPNTFTRLEWGTGKEDPKIFDLKELHTDQWCAAMKAAGMKMVILTVKHHDGFVLWQSRYTTHGIMSTGFQNGRGDVLKELSASCRKYGLKLGIYLSPADLFQIESADGLYGNGSAYTKRTIPRNLPGRPFANKTRFEFELDDYNEYFMNQLFELLTEYGPVHEVWFDGAHPKTKGGQRYNYPAWKKLIHTLAPQAVIFGREDVRWCGNEAGRTRPTEWNIIPYEQDPNLMTQFHDLDAAVLGEKEELYKGKFLHYQQAETNTSIREGWFYRDDTDQQVRSADDVFDIYERAVGGNSTFLLNIPPNREGRFSQRDVAALEETGKRIRETYSRDLFAGAKRSTNKNGDIEIQTVKPITVNRLVLQEAVATRSERVEKHAVDAWINGAWKEIAASTNIGYKRILRFSDQTASRFRIRVLEQRLPATISHISAHYYPVQPPQLSLQRDANGSLTIQPQQSAFRWNPHGQNALENLSTGMEIRYTTDGATPGKNSLLYHAPVQVEKGTIKAAALFNGKMGPVTEGSFGYPKSGWQVLQSSPALDGKPAIQAFDGKENTWWQSAGTNAWLAIDLGTERTITSFSYTPPRNRGEGLLAEGRLYASANGQDWQPVADFRFGNLVNDPSTRRFRLPAPLRTRFIKLEAVATTGQSGTTAIAELDFLE